MKIKVLTTILMLSLISIADAKTINGNISSLADTSHLELFGEQNWTYDVSKGQKGQNQLILTVNPLDESTVNSFSSFKSELIKSIKVDKAGPDGKYLVIFNLNDPDVESFDYLTDQPSRLIIDFYHSKGHAVVTQASQNESTDSDEPAAPKNKNSKNKKNKNKAENQREPASTDVLVLAKQGSEVGSETAANKSGIFDGGDPDYQRFSIKDYEIKDEAIIKSKENYYINFPMLVTIPETWNKIKEAPIVYEIVPKDEDENKQARLLLTLFEKQRFAVYLKTVEWFKDKYKNSKYNETVDYMTADVHMALWKNENRSGDFDEALQEYKEAIKKYPQSPLAEKTSLKIGYLSLEKGDALGAIQLFKEHIDNQQFTKADSISKDLAKVGIGVALAKLNRYNEAIEQFNQVEKSSKFKDMQTEAAFRRGDVYIQMKNYQAAVDDYKSSLKKYSDYQEKFPNGYYNQAEALFNLQKFRNSLETYREFVKRFPNNEQAPLAMTRLGELLEILGADKSRVMGAYLETYFRYGESPKAIIARLRMLSSKMKSMKPKEAESAVEEIKSLSKKMDLENIEQFANIMIADGLNHRGEYQKSIDFLTKFYQRNPTTSDRGLITKRIVGNISDQIRNEIDSGNFIQSLKTHQKYQDNWLKSSDRLDIKYDIGRSFEQAGVPLEAEKYYRDVINKLYSLKGTQQGHEVSVVEKIPTEDEVNLRLAEVMSQEQKNSQSYDYLKSIKSPEKFSEPLQIERINLAVKLLEKRGDTDSAIRYLTELLKNWKGQAALVADPYFKLADLQLKQGKTDDAIQSLKKIDEMMKDSASVSMDTHIKSLETLANLYLQKKQTENAIQTYKNLLENYEEKKPPSSLRYKLGEIYFNRGDIQKASDTWGAIKGDKSDFWKSLAQEQLKNSEWRGNYKKYIKRIPAMNDTSNEKKSEKN